MCDGEISCASMAAIEKKHFKAVCGLLDELWAGRKSGGPGNRPFVIVEVRGEKPCYVQFRAAADNDNELLMEAMSAQFEMLPVPPSEIEKRANILTDLGFSAPQTPPLNSQNWTRILKIDRGMQEIAALILKMLHLVYGMGEQDELKAIYRIPKDAVSEDAVNDRRNLCLEEGRKWGTKYRLISDSGQFRDYLPEVMGVAEWVDDGHVEVSSMLLNRETGGFKPGELIVLAGAGGSRKLILALQFSHHAAVEYMRTQGVGGAAIFWLSRDHSCLELADLMVRNRMDERQRDAGRWAHKTPKDILGYVESIKDIPIYFSDGFQDHDDIEHIVRKLGRGRHRRGMVVVEDLVGLGSRQEMMDVLRKMERAARNLDMPILVLVPLGEEVNLREDRQPRIGAMAFSDCILSLCEIVMLLWCKKFSGKRAEAEISIVKNRDGAPSKIQMVFDELSYRDKMEEIGGGESLGAEWAEGLSTEVRH